MTVYTKDAKGTISPKKPSNSPKETPTDTKELAEDFCSKPTTTSKKDK